MIKMPSDSVCGYRAAALAALIASTLTAAPALASMIPGTPQGGQGATGSSGFGGSGGTFQSPQAGNGSGTSGGGGGGPGGMGGSGGSSSGAGGAGGMNGSLAAMPVGSDGENGRTAAVAGGGGGAGGIGAIQTSTGTISQSIEGGAGGAGGNGADGGDSGAGLFLNHVAGAVSVQKNVVGGRGGAGGNSSGLGGSGGDGGNGLLLNQSSGPITIMSNITGGEGGSAGNSSGGDLAGFDGYGGNGIYAGNPIQGEGVKRTSIVNKGVITGGSNDGAGVVGRNLSLTNAGTIQGGASGDGGSSSHAAAIRLFPGESNRLDLHAGSRIIGNVLANSGDDTLDLGGRSDSSFDVSQIGDAKQYSGFEAFQKTGASTWTLNGVGDQKWAVENGTLQVGASSGSFANTGGDIDVRSGGTLGGYGAAGGNATIDNGAMIDPGISSGTGTLSIVGDLVLNGILNTDIAGNGDFDRLMVGSAATFGAGSELRLNALSDFSFSAGQSFNILIASSIDNLINLGLPRLGPGLTLNASNVSLGADRALRLDVVSAGAVDTPTPGSLGSFVIGLALLGLGGIYNRRRF